MNRTLLRNLSIALLALGSLFLFGSEIAYYGGWALVGLAGTATFYPLRPYSGILLIAGIVSLVLALGVFLELKTRSKP